MNDVVHLQDNLFAVIANAVQWGRPVGGLMVRRSNFSDFSKISVFAKLYRCQMRTCIPRTSIHFIVFFTGC